MSGSSVARASFQGAGTSQKRGFVENIGLAGTSRLEFRGTPLVQITIDGNSAAIFEIDYSGSHIIITAKKNGILEYTDETTSNPDTFSSTIAQEDLEKILRPGDHDIHPDEREQGPHSKRLQVRYQRRAYRHLLAIVLSAMEERQEKLKGGQYEPAAPTDLSEGNFAPVKVREDEVIADQIRLVRSMLSDARKPLYSEILRRWITKEPIDIESVGMRRGAPEAAKP